MWKRRTVPSFLLVAAFSIVAWAGCQSRQGDDKSRAARSPAPDASKTGPRRTGEPGKTEEPPPKPTTIPKVELPKEAAIAAAVKVGDTLPDAELPGLDGKAQPLRGLYGKRLTVVVFWAAEKAASVQELGDLTDEVAKPFGEKGVRVVGIDVRDTAEAARSSAELAAAGFPILLDRDGTYFAKVAKDGAVPRTFLLDASGKVLWFDTVYSKDTRRDLLTAIDVALK